MTDPAYAIRFVARQAMSTFQQLTPGQRVQLLDGLSLLLDGEEAEQAKHAAFMIEKAEEQQLKFLELLRS